MNGMRMYTLAISAPDDWNRGLVGMQVTICLVKTPHKIMCAKAAYVCEIYLCETRKGKTLLACLHAAIELKSHITLHNQISLLSL